MHCDEWADKVTAKITSLEEELGGQLKIIGELITKITVLTDTVEDLHQQHSQYSDHMFGNKEDM